MSDFGMPTFDMTEENFLNIPNLDVFRFGRPPVCIEILNTVKGLDFEEAFTNAITNHLEEIAVRFLSREDLITAKKATNRPRDINDIENLSEQIAFNPLPDYLIFAFYNTPLGSQRQSSPFMPNTIHLSSE